MNSVKSSLSKIARFVGIGTSHMLAATITGVASIAAFLSLFLFESGLIKLVGFIGFLLLGYLLTLGLALLRGER